MFLHAAMGLLDSEQSTPYNHATGPLNCLAVHICNHMHPDPVPDPHILLVMGQLCR